MKVAFENVKDRVQQKVMELQGSQGSLRGQNVLSAKKKKRSKKKHQSLNQRGGCKQQKAGGVQDTIKPYIEAF